VYDPAAAPVIPPESHEEPSLRIGDGQTLDLQAQPGILSHVSDERSPALLAGRAHDSQAEAVIHGRYEEGKTLRLTSGGGKVAHPMEQAILAGGDDEWVASLLAGSGVSRMHERVILPQVDEWLRPSLVAG
jgi:hypothetical protein